MADKLGVLAILVSVAMLGAPLALNARGRRPARSALMGLAILLLFALGELALLGHKVIIGALLFAAGGVLFALTKPWSGEEVHRTPRTAFQRCLLAVAILAVLGVGIGLRFWRLGDVPHGIEQDELAWTVGAAHATYSGAYNEAVVPTYGFQRSYLPVSSLQERLFFDRFGTTIRVARLENAVFSTVAVALFFLLVCQFARRRVALIATFLLAISTLHIASARQAHVESHVLFWVMASYFLFWLAVRHHSLMLSLATGISMVLGIWTYQTYNMTVIVIAGSLVLFALLDRVRWRFHALSMTLMLLPVLAITRREIDHERARRSFDYQFSKFDEMRHSLHGPVWERAWDMVTYFCGNLQTLFENVFVRQTSPAFEFPMIRTAGPMVMAAVLPLAALGLLLVLSSPARRAHIFVLLWLLLQLLTVPMVLGVGWGRVLLPGLPVLFVLAGIAGAYLLERLVSAYDRRGWVIAGAAFALGAALLGAGVRAYFYEVQDPEDRLIRREIVDAISAQRDSSSFIYIPTRSENLSAREQELRPPLADMHFLLGHPPDFEETERRFTYPDVDNLLDAVRRLPMYLPLYKSRPGPLLIMMPHRNRDRRLPVQPQLAGVYDCYDVTPEFSGKYIDLLEIAEASLSRPHCSA